MADALTLLIIGGYGTFGGRLVDLLKDERRLTLIVAGRSASRASAFCAARPATGARLEAAPFDRDGDLAAQLRALAPHLVVDASGPFQAYGPACYRLVEACIDLGIHYLDLADGSQFVAGVTRFDARARAAGVYVLSGVSSFPVLTAAVVRHLAAGMSRVISIRGGIAPSPFAGVGLNVIRAIAGYAGQPVAIRRRGESTIAYPFSESWRATIAPPGHLPLRSTLFSLVDVPDLRVLAELWPAAEEIWMGAGPVPAMLHRCLMGLAWLVRWRWLPSLSPLSRLMSVVMNRVRWGEHRGGMFVAVAGSDPMGRTVQRSWHLLAEGDDGPLIPSMAIEALIRKTLDTGAPAPGARPAAQALELADYEARFAGRRIVTGLRDATAGAPLFEGLVGSAWSGLPVAVRQMHASPADDVAEGRCEVQRGRGLHSNAVASLFGFPRAAQDLPVRVHFQRANDTERWTRTFGDRVFASSLRAGRGRSAHLLVERIGLFDFAQALVLENDRLRLVLRHWSLFGIALPIWLAPQSDSYETEVDGCFCFHVEIRHRWLGLLVRYRGWLRHPGDDVSDQPVHGWVPAGLGAAWQRRDAR